MNWETQPRPFKPKICMLDIETLDTAPTAKIISLGAVDVYGTEIFYQEIDHNQPGRTESLDTINWWNQQSTPIPGSSVSLTEILSAFYAWYIYNGFTEVWCNGSDFDFVILGDAYKKSALEKTPWKYNEIRDLRTLIKLFPEVPAPTINTQQHNALQDSIHQAAHLKEILNHVKQLQQTHTRQFIASGNS